MGREVGKGPLTVPEGWVPQARNSFSFSAAMSRWGDLETATCFLHPHLGTKRMGADPLCGPCPCQHSGTTSLKPGLVGRAALETQNVLPAGAPGGSFCSIREWHFLQGLPHACGDGGDRTSLVCGLFLKLLEQTIRVK